VEWDLFSSFINYPGEVSDPEVIRLIYRGVAERCVSESRKNTGGKTTEDNILAPEK